MRIDDYKTLNLQTGDGIFCSGKGLFPMAINLHARYNIDEVYRNTLAVDMTHVAKVVKKYDRPWVFESTATGMNKKTGVQMNPFDEWLKHYDGKVYAKRYKFVRDVDYLTRVGIFMCKMYGKRYESGIDGLVALLRSGGDIAPDEAKNHNVFCGELYVAMDLFTGLIEGVDPQLFPPYKIYLEYYPNVPTMPVVRIK